MLRAYPSDLDCLESPLLTPTTGGLFGPTPGSALAERIFNDPDSWEAEDLDDGAFSDRMAWFVEEIERFRSNSATSTNTALSSDDDGMSDVEFTIMPSPASTVQGSQVKGIRRRSVHPISLELPKDVQARLSKILEQGALPPAFGQDFSRTPSTANSVASLSSAGTEAFNLASPMPVHSASTTLSFLEWYGIYPDSPHMDPNFRKSIYGKRKSKALGPPLHIPSPKPVESRPTSLLSPSALIPELQIEPPKRGSSVPPLQSLKPMLDEILVQATIDVSPLEENRPPIPPGLPQLLEPTPASTSNQGPPPSGQTPAVPETPPRQRLGRPPPYARAEAPGAGSYSRALPASANTASTPVRRLPSIPPSSATTPAQYSAALHVPCNMSSPLPSSLPSCLLSPEPTPSQTVVFQGRPVSALRSPMGGPAGPRSRASSGTRSGPRLQSGLARRPPVLQL